MYADHPSHRHPLCFNNCTFVKAQYLLEQVQSLSKGIVEMSRAMWCDQGNHAFSERDPGKRHFTETMTVDGKEQTVERSVNNEAVRERHRVA